MPIRINLLAEAQAAEDLRRRDPVKRSIWAASFVVILVLAWSGSIQFKIVQARQALAAQESKWNSLEKNYQGVVDKLKMSGEIDRKLAALSRLSTNRFLWGSALNALRQVMVDNVNVTRIKTDQTYAVSEAVAPKPGVAGSGRSAASVEKKSIVIEARDYAGEQNYNKFKTAVATVPFMQNLLQRPDNVRLIMLSAPSPDPEMGGKNFVTFTLDCQFPDVRREE